MSKQLMVFKATYRFRDVMLVPVYHINGHTAWTGLDERGEELGILAVSAQGSSRLWSPHPRTDQPKKLVRCRLKPRGSVQVISSQPDEVIGLRRHTIIDVPTPTCHPNSFRFLRKKARDAQRGKRPGTLESWSALDQALIGGQKGFTIEDLTCALRAEGWRQTGTGLWTFD